MMEDKTYFKIKDYFRKYRRDGYKEQHILHFLAVKPEYLLERLK